MAKAAAQHDASHSRAATGRVVLGVACLALAWYLRSVLFVVFAGVLFAILLNAVSGWICRLTGIQYGWALTLSVLGVLGVLGGVIGLFGARLVQEVAQLTQTVPASLDRLRGQLEATRWGPEVLNGAPSAADLLNSRQMWSQLGGLISTTTSAFFGVIVVVFVGLYGAAAPDRYLDGVLKLFPRERRDGARRVFEALGHDLRWWMIGHLATMSLVGLLIGIGLSVLGVPQPLGLAVLAFFAELVPNFGPTMAAVPAILLAWSQGWTQAIYVLLLYVIVQLTESYAILPLAQRRAVALPPVLTIVAVVIFGMLGGVVGAIVATPMMLTLYLLVKMVYVERALAPVDE